MSPDKYQIFLQLLNAGVPAEKVLIFLEGESLLALRESSLLVHHQEALSKKFIFEPIPAEVSNAPESFYRISLCKTFNTCFMNLLKLSYHLCFNQKDKRALACLFTLLIGEMARYDYLVAAEEANSLKEKVRKCSSALKNASESLEGQQYIHPLSGVVDEFDDIFEKSLLSFSPEEDEDWDDLLSQTSEEAAEMSEMSLAGEAMPMDNVGNIVRLHRTTAIRGDEQDYDLTVSFHVEEDELNVPDIPANTIELSMSSDDIEQTFSFRYLGS